MAFSKEAYAILQTAGFRRAPCPVERCLPRGRFRARCPETSRGAPDTAVVAEGDCEARSIGSYSVRLYSSAGAAPGDDTVFYEAGLVLPRDGSVEKIMLDRLDGKADSLIVIMRSAGSGSFLAADAFSVANGKLALRASVGGLSPQADPITVLRAALSRRRR